MEQNKIEDDEDGDPELFKKEKLTQIMHGESLGNVVRMQRKT
jgi:hypothetical protein